MAALATPLVLSVHSVVSFDFATAQLPGWHATVFPPYFVAGAIYGGFAMVLCLAIPCREFFGLEDIMTKRHMDNMGKILLATGMLVAYSYLCEAFIAWYGGNPNEQFTFRNRAFGPYAWACWTLMIWCNVLARRFLWSEQNPQKNMISALHRGYIREYRRCGLSEFVIIVTTLTRNFLPSSWHNFRANLGQPAGHAGRETSACSSRSSCCFAGSLPMVAMAEVKR